MNKKGQQFLVGFALLTVVLVFILTLFGLIPIFKETLDDARGDPNINCPGTPDFNQTAFDADNDFNQLVRRPTCFVTGITMVWFISAFLLGAVSWLVLNFRKAK